ncbi:hypothetical protein GCM10012284_55840 [Mangrovihabitans endophyticus]|uniref:Uncharacterized protein n=1 Tax=Mangrovihabitans endophyticus TaxID=1751298 RepID=A0A8J3C5X9_9ACTN|nr:hypothetical protein GCM10012284_55840 [Mangrovihabitans endophyticus]
MRLALVRLALVRLGMGLVRLGLGLPRVRRLRHEVAPSIVCPVAEPNRPGRCRACPYGERCVTPTEEVSSAGVREGGQERGTEATPGARNR